MTNPEGFPWGANKPTRAQRAIVALLIAILCALNLYVRYARMPESRSDFFLIRFGAEALLHGANPYVLVGPGMIMDSQWSSLYPATAYVVAIPFTLLSDHGATIAFVFISVLLLAYGITAGSWHRLPLFPSKAFITSVQTGQWSILMTAALFIPWVSMFLSAKPQAGLPVIAGTSSRRSLVYAAVGTAILLVVSLALAPSWPTEWLSLIRSSDHMRPPVLRLGGPLVLLVLLRWRRPEAWLIAVQACLPQTWAAYNVLILLAIPQTYREACVISLVSSVGALAGTFLIDDYHTMDSLRLWGALMVATAYLPATVMVLRRPNRGPIPAWMALVVGPSLRRVKVEPQGG